MFEKNHFLCLVIETTDVLPFYRKYVKKIQFIDQFDTLSLNYTYTDNILFWFEIYIHIMDIAYTFTSLLNLP